MTYTQSEQILDRNRAFIPGGISSTNRHTSPTICFTKGKGSRLWDADGNEYIDYHAAFAPQVLGYHHPKVERAVSQALETGSDLFGSGPSEAEGLLAERICSHLAWADRAALLEHRQRSHRRRHSARTRGRRTRPHHRHARRL